MPTPVSQQYADFVATNLDAELLTLTSSTVTSDLIGSSLGQSIGGLPANSGQQISFVDLGGPAASLSVDRALTFPSFDNSLFLGDNATWSLVQYLNIPASSLNGGRVVLLSMREEFIGGDRIAIEIQRGGSDNVVQLSVQIFNGLGFESYLYEDLIVNQSYFLGISHDGNFSPGNRISVFLATNPGNLVELGPVNVAVNPPIAGPPSDLPAISFGARVVNGQVSETVDRPYLVQGLFVSSRALGLDDLNFLLSEFTPIAIPEGIPEPGIPLPSFEPLVESLPLDVSYQPGTIVSTRDSGIQQALVRHDRPRATYSLRFDVLAERPEAAGAVMATVEQLQDLLDSVIGGLEVFRFTDPFDFEAPAIARVTKFGSLVQGIFYPAPDGQRTVFQAGKVYQIIGAGEAIRPLTRIRGFSDIPGGASFDVNTGVLTFDSPPAPGDRFTGNFHFDVSVRFSDDTAATTLLAQISEDIDTATSEAASITLQEERELPAVEPPVVWAVRLEHQFALERQFEERTRARRYDTIVDEHQSGFPRRAPRRAIAIADWELEGNEALSLEEIEYLICLYRLTRESQAFQYKDYDGKIYDVRFSGGALNLSLNDSLGKLVEVGSPETPSFPGSESEESPEDILATQDTFLVRVRFFGQFSPTGDLVDLGTLELPSPGSISGPIETISVELAGGVNSGELGVLVFAGEDPNSFNGFDNGPQSFFVNGEFIQSTSNFGTVAVIIEAVIRNDGAEVDFTSSPSVLSGALGTGAASSFFRANVYECNNLTIREQPQVGALPVLNDDGTPRDLTIFSFTSAPIAHAWVITRTDGFQIGSTNCDRALEVTVRGGTVICDPRNGGVAIATERRVDGSTGNTELEFLLPPTGINPREIIAGFYENSRVDFLAVNWATGEVFQMGSFNFGRLRTYYSADFGQVFEADARSLYANTSITQQRLVQIGCPLEFGQQGPNLCNADITGLEDAVTIVEVPTFDSIRVTGTEGRSGTFQYGRLEFAADTPTPELQTKVFSVIATDLQNGILTVNPPFFVIPQAGDVAIARQRCLKDFTANCIGEFDNGPNFGGQPHVPGPRFFSQTQSAES